MYFSVFDTCNLKNKKMKQIIVMCLVALIPIVSFSQGKRSKKSDNSNTLSSSYEYMVIKGIEVPLDDADVDKVARSANGKFNEAIEMKRLIKKEVKLIVSFDYGNSFTKEMQEMMKKASGFRSMVSALNAASEKGWEFMSANVTSNDLSSTHYYYMKRKK